MSLKVVKQKLRSIVGDVLFQLDKVGLSRFFYRPLLKKFPNELRLIQMYFESHPQRIAKKISKVFLDICENGLQASSDSFAKKKYFLRLCFYGLKNKKISETIVNNIERFPVKKMYASTVFGLFDTKLVDDSTLSHCIHKNKYLNESNYKVCLPKVLGEGDTQNCYNLTIPDVSVYQLSDVQVIGGAQVLKDKTLIVYEPAADPKHISVAGAWLYVKQVSSKKSIVCFEAINERNIEVGALIYGRSSGNYFHWVVEYMSRLHTLDLDSQYDNVPLIVPDWLHAQYYDVLSILNYKNRPIIKFSKNTVLKVEKLFIPNYQTNIIDNLQHPNWFISGVSAVHLKEMRSKILKHYSLTQSNINSKNKIYISRKNFFDRSLKNEKKVEKLFLSKGYKIIQPEKLSFEEQVRAFNEASIIVGPGGAAFTNLLFCSEGATVVNFINEYNKDFCLFSNIANIVGANYYHMAGKDIKSKFLDNKDLLVSKYGYNWNSYFVSEKDIIHEFRKIDKSFLL